MERAKEQILTDPRRRQLAEKAALRQDYMQRPLVRPNGGRPASSGDFRYMPTFLVWTTSYVKMPGKQRDAVDPVHTGRRFP